MIPLFPAVPVAVNGKEVVACVGADNGEHVGALEIGDAKSAGRRSGRLYWSAAVTTASQQYESRERNGYNETSGECHDISRGKKRGTRFCVDQ